MAQQLPIPPETEQVVSALLEASFRVHRNLGPGLLESVYEICLCHELSKMQVPFERQRALPVSYDGLDLDAGFRLDVLANDRVIVELKAVEEVAELHKPQLITYLKLTKKRIGLLINFNTKRLKDGITGLVVQRSEKFVVPVVVQ